MTFDENNKLSYNYRRLINYIDKGITNIPGNNAVSCLNYLLNKNKPVLDFCKKRGHSKTIVFVNRPGNLMYSIYLIYSSCSIYCTYWKHTSFKLN